MNAKRNCHYHSYDYNGNITINNITNITNVTGIKNFSGRRPWNKHHNKASHKNGGYHKREPKLMRFCKSFGILDQDKVMRMSDGEIVDGLLGVERHVRHDMARHASGMCHDLYCCGKGIVGVAKGLFGIVASPLK